MIEASKQVYFISDAHLGIDLKVSSSERERLLVGWLEQIKSKASHLYLVGDIFDFWFEYKSTVPKGYFRLFNALTNLVEAGVEIHFIKGNHDMWTFGYFEEMGIHVHDDHVIKEHHNTHFYVTHGDGKGTGHSKYLLIKSILRSRLGQFIFSCIHPTLGLSLMKRMSGLSRHHGQNSTHKVDHKSIMVYADDLAKTIPYDYFICGHQHDAQITPLANHPTKSYVNLGDWMSYFTYAVWDGKEVKIQKYNK